MVPTDIAGPKNAVVSIQPFKVVKLNNKKNIFLIFNDSLPHFGTANQI